MHVSSAFVSARLVFGASPSRQVVGPDGPSAAAPMTASQVTGGQHAFAHLTSDDREVLAAATGVRLAPDGTVAENKTGEFPDWNIFLQMDTDRREGVLTGAVDESYFATLIKARENDPSWDPTSARAAIDFLRDRADSRRAEADYQRTSARLA